MLLRQGNGRHLRLSKGSTFVCFLACSVLNNFRTLESCYFDTCCLLDECMFVHPSPGYHAKEDEGQNEEKKYRADDAGIAGGPISSPPFE